MNTAPPNRGRERNKGVGMCTVSGGQWSWFLSFYLYVAFGTQTQVARLVCGKRLLPTEPPCRPFFFLERVLLGGSGRPLTQGTWALALQS